MFSPDDVVIRRFPASQSPSEITPQANHDHNPLLTASKFEQYLRKKHKNSRLRLLSRARERSVSSICLSVFSPAALRQKGLPGRQSDGNFFDCFVFFLKNLFKSGVTFGTKESRHVAINDCLIRIKLQDPTNHNAGKES